MRILGICHDVWICSACVVEDGRVVAASAEERLDRVKRSRQFPSRAIAECLRLAGTAFEAIDEIAVAWHPGLELATMPAGYLDGRRSRAEHLLQVPARLLELSGQQPAGEMSLHDLWPGAPPVTYVGHYAAHVGTAFFLSPFESAAVLILDGRGERASGLLGAASGTHLEIIETIDFPHSLGQVYSAVTQFLGFRPDVDEWKVMALAAYADWNNEYYEPLRALIHVDDSGRFAVELDWFAYYHFANPRWYSDRFVKAFGPPRHPRDPIDDRHQRIAAALQRVFEESVAAIGAALHRRAGLDRLVAGGGCFMNGVLNGRIESLTPFTESFIGPCPDDSGTSIGAALWLHAGRTGRRPEPPSGMGFWGSAYTDEACLRAARTCLLPHARVVEDPGLRAAHDVGAGHLVGWFQGQAEFGQRALGARSILADPRRPEMRDRINSAIKYREAFRPFAPAVLSERLSEWFMDAPAHAPRYMERVLPFQPGKAHLVPSVVHADGTGRVQAVDGDAPPRFRRLIESFAELTGIPLVLNTSFNRNGEPIVNSPDDAIRAFYACGLDVLYLGDVRIAKHEED